MTLPNIVLSSEAHADLLDIEAYIAHQDGEARAEMVIGVSPKASGRSPSCPAWDERGPISGAAYGHMPLHPGLSFMPPCLPLTASSSSGW
jgi:hypothetical protein